MAPEGSNGGRPKYPLRKGPKPARHIPWPEIFKHHISLVEGHLKMIDMVRKHTVEGSANHRTICDMIDNTKQILFDSKTVSRIFIPPLDHVEQVPLGSSPAEAKSKGEGIRPEELDHKLGQSKAPSSLKLEQTTAKKVAANVGGSDSAPVPVDAPSADANASSKKVRFSDVSMEPSPSVAQMFFMDSQPTPVHLPSSLNPSNKRKSSSQHSEPAPEPVEVQPSKKARKDHADHATILSDVQEDTQPMPITTAQTHNSSEQAHSDVQLEYEDISAEVDKRMKEKEEKRKAKDQLKVKKKRKRDSEGSTAGAVESATTTELEKPKKKKKSKIAEDAGSAGGLSPEKLPTAAGEDLYEGANAATPVSVEKPKKKKKVNASPESPTTAKNEPVGRSSTKRKTKKTQASSETTGPDKEDVLDENSTPSKRSLVENSEGHAEGEVSTPKKKKARTSQDTSTSEALAVKQKKKKRLADVAEVGDVEGQSKKKKLKRKST
ncbi:MAG: hypothetical protein Q9221_001218 [Calogaya cf. arnoldii]